MELFTFIISIILSVDIKLFIFFFIAAFLRIYWRVFFRFLWILINILSLLARFLNLYAGLKSIYYNWEILRQVRYIVTINYCSFLKLGFKVFWQKKVY